jgi:hypothetical protein
MKATELKVGQKFRVIGGPSRDRNHNGRIPASNGLAVRIHPDIAPDHPGPQDAPLLWVDLFEYEVYALYADDEVELINKNEEDV